ncbi:MAG TPA: hypothetical protein VG123_22140 [Streptosporangiaceae bacterium]|nr:hypothetical protein [Streptosporangiaceae bacterium]
MSPRTIGKTLLAGDPDQARAQLEKLSGTQPAEDKAAGERLRAVAVELVRCGLQVALVDYLEGWRELEATLPQAPHLGPVTVDLDAAGTGCQLAWDQWADISTRDGAGQAAAAVAALLRGVAGCPPLTGPTSLMTPRDPAPPGSCGRRLGPGRAWT